MIRDNHVRRRLAAVLSLAFVAASLTTAASPQAAAAPAVSAAQTVSVALRPVARPAEPRDDEGATKSLTDQLDAASRSFLEAKDTLAASKKKQAALSARLKQLDSDLITGSASVGEIARGAYRTGRLGPMTAVLNAGSPDGFLERAVTLDLVAVKQDRVLRELRQTLTAQQRAKAAVDAEVRSQRKQLALMAKRKAQAEGAIKAARLDNAAADARASRSTGKSSKARAARRNSDGSLPGESCSANDPTTSGCITPRTLHAMRQAKAAGFERFVSCFRPRGSGEHPKGRACDFASDRSGFGGVATGGSRSYGDRLANYFVNNADRLGVLYVIWFKRIWLPSSGWRAYSRGNGDPSSDHTNHVHLSMR